MTPSPPHVDTAGRLDRLRDAARRVADDGGLHVDVDRRAGYGAWAWRDGHVAVTPALIDTLDADELAAVLAHELGHLRRGASSGPVGVADASPDESDADAAGCAILAARGVPTAAMITMLRSLSRNAGLDLDARIDAATRVCDTPH
jgi:predicted Zn-dependent protease